MPKCVICQKELYYLTQHLIPVHGIDGKEYRRRFPNSPLCDPRQSKLGEGLKVTCPVCERQFRFITPRHVKLHGFTPKQFAEKFPDAPLKAPDVAKACSEKARAHVLRQQKDPKFIEALRRGMEKTHKLNEADPEYRRKRMLWMKNAIYGRYANHWLDGERYRSRPELCLAILFQHLDLDWQYEPTEFPYMDENQKLRHYIPDFLVGGVYVEYRPKGMQDDRLLLKKHAVPGLKIISEKDLRRWGVHAWELHLALIEGDEKTTTFAYWEKYLISHKPKLRLPKWLTSATRYQPDSSTTLRRFRRHILFSLE